MESEPAGVKTRVEGTHEGGSRSGRAGPAGPPPREDPEPPSFEIVLLPGGNAIFSWNTPDIQGMAESLGVAEFEPPRWCG